MKDNRTIKAENVHKAIEKQGYFYILAEKYYDEGYIGPKYIIATDDPDFREKHPSFADMVIVSVDRFMKMAEAINTSLLNDQREVKRHELYHNDKGYYEEVSDDEEIGPLLAIAERPMDPVFDSLEAKLTRERLMKAMEQLNEKPRKRLLAYYFEGLTFRQIAEREGVGDKTIRESIDGAIKKMKKIL
ncbi:MAG: sigma-70 family RNA polymerase sigma factor [Ruminococcus sp.]|nr:sigma-70 family RNA polymerase sigma factor [Ruminococcus sp.]